MTDETFKIVNLYKTICPCTHCYRKVNMPEKPMSALLPLYSSFMTGACGSLFRPPKLFFKWRDVEQSNYTSPDKQKEAYQSMWRRRIVNQDGVCCYIHRALERINWTSSQGIYGHLAQRDVQISSEADLAVLSKCRHHSFLQSP